LTLYSLKSNFIKKNHQIIEFSFFYKDFTVAGPKKKKNSLLVLAHVKTSNILDFFIKNLMFGSKLKEKKYFRANFEKIC